MKDQPIMRTLPKTFLIISVVSLVAGLTSAGGDFAYGILRPVAAISFELFLITQLLGGVMAEFDAEERTRPGAEAPQSPAKNPARGYGGNNAQPAR